MKEEGRTVLDENPIYSKAFIDLCVYLRRSTLSKKDSLSMHFIIIFFLARSLKTRDPLSHHACLLSVRMQKKIQSTVFIRCKLFRLCTWGWLTDCV